jgi:hypothetical protein
MPAKPVFTKQNAATFAAKAHESRRLNKAKRLADIDEANRIIAEAAQLRLQIAATPDWMRDRLRRVRLQLERLDKLAEAETDPTKLDRLASAAARLQEQERQLDNRPLPRQASKPRRSVPTDPEPVPTPEQAKPAPEQPDSNNP